MTDVNLLRAAEVRWANLFWDAWSRGAWLDLSADEREYGQRHLAQHLAATTDPCARLALLIDRAWRDAWRTIDPSDEGFLQDVDLAWEHAGDDVALEIRCCLCRSTAASMQAAMPPGLLTLSVKFGFISFEEALQRARRTPDEGWRAIQLEELAGVAPAGRLSQILPMAHEIDSGYARARALAAVGARAGPSDRTHIRNAVGRLPDARDRARVLAALLAGEPEGSRGELVTDLLRAADGIAHGFEWKEILEPAVPNIPRNALPALIANISAIGHRDSTAGGEAARVLVRAARSAGVGDWPRILEGLATVPGPFHAANALCDLAMSIPQEHSGTAIQIADGLSHPTARFRALKALGGDMSPALRADALAAARNEPSPSVRAYALVETLDTLQGSERAAVLEEAMAAARAASMPLQSLVSVAVHVPDDLRREALDRAFEALDAESNRSKKAWAALELHRSLRDGEDRDRDAVRDMLSMLAAAAGTLELPISDLTRIAAVLKEEQRLALLERAHQETREINNADGQIHAFRELLPATPPALFETAIETARSILGERERAEAFVALTARLPLARSRELVGEARSQYKSLLDEVPEAQATVALAAFVDGPDRSVYLLHAIERLAVAAPRDRLAYATSNPDAPGTVVDLHVFTRALALAAHPPDSEPARGICLAALSAASAIRFDSRRAGALAIVARHIPAEEWPRVLEASSDLNPAARIRILTERVATEKGPARRKHLREAIALASEGCADDALRVEITNNSLAELARLMDDETATDVLRIVAEIPSPWWRTQALRKINPYLTDAQRHSAMAIAVGIPPDNMGLLEEVLQELMHPPPKPESTKHFPAPRREEAVPAEEEWNRTMALGTRFSEGGRSILKSSRLVELAARSVGAPQAQRRERTSAVLRQLARERRPMVLREIAVLAPLLASVYRGRDTARATCEAVRNVCAWPL